jgi:hypothetical protein
VKNAFEEGLVHPFALALPGSISAESGVVLRQNNFLKRAILTCDSRMSGSGWLHHQEAPWQLLVTESVALPPE